MSSIRRLRIEARQNHQSFLCPQACEPRAPTLDFGEDTGIPVSENYKVPFKFTGMLRKVVIRLGDAELSDADKKAVDEAKEQEAPSD